MLVGLLALGLSAIVSQKEEKGFVAHMREFGLMYSGEEYHLRLGLYLAAVRQIEEHNSGNRGFLLGLNQFATWTNAEYQVLLGRIDTTEALKELSPRRSLRANLPVEFDWTALGKVQEVKDQGKCGSCWTFGAIGAQESMWAINKNELLSLSEQNLLDCTILAFGCKGGNPITAYLHVLLFQSGHFNLESSYPYEAKQGPCRYSSSGAVTLLVDAGLVRQSETAVQQVLYEDGPLGVAIDASHDSFQKYKSGVYLEPACSSTKLDHEVLLVGWGTDPSAYWLIKNSWGVKWGEAGYFKLARNKNNHCGIATEAVLPTLYEIV
jgi:cathepsin L